MLNCGFTAAAAAILADRAAAALAKEMVRLGKWVRVWPQIVLLKVWSSPK
jgi:hypothetical protein